MRLELFMLKLNVGATIDSRIAAIAAYLWAAAIG